jgi:methylmalonyl-CoA mutase N-terminal domain/subunit
MLILALRAQDAPSTHFLEIHMFRAVKVIFGNVTLDNFECHNSEDGMLETHTMTIIDHSAVKNAIWNLRSKVT